MSDQEKPVEAVRASEDLTPQMKEALERVEKGPVAVQARAGLDALLAGRNLQASSTHAYEGVVFTMRPPGGSNYFKATELAGKTTNLTPIFEALLCVIAIDGRPEPTPASRAMIDALADRVGRRALDSLAEWYQKALYPEIDEAMDYCKLNNIPLDGPEFIAILDQIKAAKLKK